MSEDWISTVSSAVRRAIDIMFVSNPRGTSLGVLTGIAFHGVAKFLEARGVLGLQSISLYHFAAVWIVLYNIPSYFRRHKLPPEVNEALAIIRAGVKSERLSKPQARLMYVSLCNKVLENAVLAADTQHRLNAIQQTLTNLGGRES